MYIWGEMVNRCIRYAVLYALHHPTGVAQARSPLGRVQHQRTANRAGRSPAACSRCLHPPFLKEKPTTKNVDKNTRSTVNHPVCFSNPRPLSNLGSNSKLIWRVRVLEPFATPDDPCRRSRSTPDPRKTALEPLKPKEAASRMEVLTFFDLFGNDVH